MQLPSCATFESRFDALAFPGPMRRDRSGEDEEKGTTTPKVPTWQERRRRARCSWYTYAGARVYADYPLYVYVRVPERCAGLACTSTPCLSCLPPSLPGRPASRRSPFSLCLRVPLSPARTLSVPLFAYSGGTNAISYHVLKLKP